ncbi:MAG: endopeptidase La [Phycisphaerales bacterium]|nr:endopeptidase La [Phycisphaerales bacterium]
MKSKASKTSVNQMARKRSAWAAKQQAAAELLHLLEQAADAVRRGVDVDVAAEEPPQADLKNGEQSRGAVLSTPAAANAPATEVERLADKASAATDRTASVSGPLVHQVRIPDELPILPVREAVAFPGAVIPLAIGRDSSRRLLDDVMPGEKIIGVVTQKSELVENPQPSDLYTMGTVAIVLKMLRAPEGHQSIVVHGLVRFKILEVISQDPYMKAKVQLLQDELPQPSPAFDLLVQTVKQSAQRMIELSPNIPDEAAGILNDIDSPGTLADFLAANLHESVAEKQSILEEIGVENRLTRVRDKLAARINQLELQEKIHSQVRSSIDKTQRNYFLQEQLKAIQKELGQEDEQSGEVADLRSRIEAARVPAVVKKETDRELARLANIPQASPEFGVIRSFLETVAELPWSVGTQDDLDIARARHILDRDHYDLDKIKKRIIEFLAVRRLNPGGRGPILCFLGPPGVGKTSLGKSIAESLGRKFVRMSLGGVRDEADIRGHRRTYIGAMPGRIIQELRKAGSNNPVMMLDEVDKLGADFRGDPAAALLEVLDPQQNSTFQDHYLGVPFDLSKVIFICTANYMEPVPPALKDRMEIIEIPGYAQQDKLLIARRYLVPRQLQENGITRHQCEIPQTTLNYLIDHYTREAGVRNLERTIGSVIRGVAAKLAENLPSEKAAVNAKPQTSAAGASAASGPATAKPQSGDPTAAGQVNQAASADGKTDGTALGQPMKPSPAVQAALKLAKRVIVNPGDLHAYLGPTLFDSELALRSTTPGVATGLAYTPFGGEILFVEATRMPGKGHLKLTGQIGAVMRESAQAAYSLLKANAARLGLDEKAFAQLDVHVHVPAGAIPKDGPSAGVAMYTALASLFLNQPARPDVAMTGEITLRGLVLPIGGVKEKVIAAQRAGIKTVVLPRRNEKNVAEVLPHVRKAIRFVYADTVDDVLKHVLVVERIRRKSKERKQLTAGKAG